MMLSIRGISMISCVLMAVLVISACSGGGPSKEEVARQAEFDALTEAKAQLDAKRQELQDLGAELLATEADAAVAAEGGGEAEVEGEEGEMADAVDAAETIEALENEIAGLTDDFGGSLVAYLNADPMIEGEPPTESQLAALRMKSSEDIVLAKEWIAKGGDYKRAIEIYSNALLLDPGNEEVEAALAWAEENRWMSEERFSQAKKGMSEAEVRSLLGQANLHNVREYPDNNNAVAWFYPTAENGAAAAIWFQPNKKSGVREAYQLKFDEVPGQGGEEDGE